MVVMDKMVAVYGVCLATLLAVTYGAVPPSGKCNTHHITTIPSNLKSLLGEWDFIYITDDAQTIDAIDHVTAVVILNQDQTLKMVTTRVLKDKSSSSQEYTLTIVDDVILEDAIDNGKPTHFHAYPLAKTNDNAILYYRCADLVRAPVDTRYIALPRGKSISEESLKQLLEADKSYKFKGELVKLPNQHS